VNLFGGNKIGNLIFWLPCVYALLKSIPKEWGRDSFQNVGIVLCSDTNDWSRGFHCI